MSIQHTPGPWRIAGLIITADAGNPEQPIAHIVQFLPKFAEESAANARLIAAAPDLLAALEEIVGYTGDAETALDDENLMDRVYDAISKARWGK